MISPSKRAFEKYKPRGLFSEFYGIVLNNKTKGLAKIVRYIYRGLRYIEVSLYGIIIVYKR